MTDVLKPCPFCGGEAERRENPTLGDMSMAHCRTCGASAYDRKWNGRAACNDVKEIIAANVQSVCDWDDRTSPDDYPGHLLITPAELTELLEGVVDAASAALSRPIDPKAEVAGYTSQYNLDEVKEGRLGYICPTGTLRPEQEIPLYAKKRADGDAEPSPEWRYDEAAAEREFTDYFVRNYPGPNTVIFDPKWHAPKLFSAASKAIQKANEKVTLREDGFAAGFEDKQAGIDEGGNPYEEGSARWRDWNDGWESANEEEPDATPALTPAEKAGVGDGDGRLADIAQKINHAASAAYCASLDKFSKSACLGWEAKVASGDFSKTEMEAHAEANTLMGRHQGLSAALEILRALSTLKPAQGDGECQYAIDVGMPEHRCEGGCQYERYGQLSRGPDQPHVLTVFDQEHPELYWHVAKGKVCAGEPLYGAIITSLRGEELGHGESEASLEQAFVAAIRSAGLESPTLAAQGDGAQEERNNG